MTQDEKIANDLEAHALLGLVDFEFRSDPMSVQCFDLRIVERVRRCVEQRDRLKGDAPTEGDKDG